MPEDLSHRPDAMSHNQEGNDAPSLQSELEKIKAENSASESADARRQEELQKSRVVDADGSQHLSALDNLKKETEANASLTAEQKADTLARIQRDREDFLLSQPEAPTRVEAPPPPPTIKDQTEIQRQEELQKSRTVDKRDIDYLAYLANYKAQTEANAGLTADQKAERLAKIQSDQEDFLLSLPEAA